MAYLTQSMDDPDLKSSLSDRSGEEGIYHIVVKELQRRYDRPRVIHRNYVETMTSLTPIKHTRARYAKLADTLEKTLQGFIRLKGENCQQIMTTITENLLPDISKHYWGERTIKCREVPPVEELIDFLRERADQAEEEEASRPKHPPEQKKGGKSNHFKQRAAVNVSAPQQNSTPTPQQQQRSSGPQRKASMRAPYPQTRYPCKLCNEYHYLFLCSTFEKMTITQRKEHVCAHRTA